MSRPALLRATLEPSAHGFTSRLTLEGGGGTAPGFPIYFEVESDGDPVTPPANLDHAALAVLPHAMSQGLDVHVEGALSPGLTGQLAELSRVWSGWLPDRFRPVRVAASRAAAPAPARSGAVLAFSGGVDSSFCLEWSRRCEPARRRPIAAGLLVHGFDVPLADAPSFATALAAARRILDHYEVAPLRVRTNWRDVCVDWEMMFGVGLAAALHTLNGHFARAMMASDVRLGDEVFPWGTNSITDPLLSTPAWPIEIGGRGFRRIDKIRMIAEVPVLAENLRVCWQLGHGGGNCGVCEKCVRTRLEFAACGVPRVPAIADRTVSVREVLSVRSRIELKVKLMQELVDGDSALDTKTRLAVRYQILRESARNRRRSARRRRRALARS